VKLGVNIDHLATLRQARGGAQPDPVEGARICKRVGAHSVVMHLREDRRHIQDHDLFRVKKEVSIRLNLEMSIASPIVDIACRLVPAQATLVPEKRQERTTEGGLDLFQKTSSIARSTARLKERGIEVSLFIDPDLRQVEKAKELGVDAVEFHTGDYANQKNKRGFERELARLEKAADFAKKIPLRVYAGHGLDHGNVSAICKIRTIEELNIGYSIVTRAVWVGFENSVREMLGLLCP
jgi:pyridoxine 5-phosphate synthase